LFFSHCFSDYFDVYQNTFQSFLENDLHGSFFHANLDQFFSQLKGYAMNTLISKVKLSLGRFSKDQDGVTAIEYALIAALVAVVRDEGVTAIEYALIAALVAVVIIGGATLLGTNLNTLFENIAGKI